MYRMSEPRLLAYALRRAPPEQAKDAVADVLLAAWRRFDELPDDPLPWLIEATRKTLANQRRSAQRSTALAERIAQEPTRVDFVPDVDSREAEVVQAALARLRPSDRELLTLIAWEELTPSQAARSLRCSAVALRVRLHRARRRFAAALAEVEREASATKASGESRTAAANEVS